MAQTMTKMKHILITTIAIFLLLGCSKPKDQTTSEEIQVAENVNQKIKKIAQILNRNTELEHRFSTCRNDNDFNREDGRLQDFAEQRENEINEIVMDLDQDIYPRYFKLTDLIADYFRINYLKIKYSKLIYWKIEFLGKRDLDSQAIRNASNSTMNDIADFVLEINNLSKEELEKRLSFLRKRSQYESWRMLRSNSDPIGKLKTSVGENQNRPTSQVENKDESMSQAGKDKLIAQASGISLKYAVSSGDIETVKQQLAAGADVNKKMDDSGWTPLFTAVVYGQKEIAELLLNKGADVNAMPLSGPEQGNTPLDRAIAPDLLLRALSKETVSHLRKVGFKTETQPGIVNLLRKHGGMRSSELKAERIEKQKASALRLQNLKQANKALFNASVKGNIDAVKQQLTNGADVNAKNAKYGWTSLHEVANKEIAELLIEQGANVNAIGLEKRTPLHRASMKGRKEVIETLLGKGADINAKSGSGSFKGATPLDMAKNNEIATLLRKHGGKTGEELKGNRKLTEGVAKIEKTDSGEKNSANLGAGRALIIAAARGNKKAVNQHLNSGTDVNAVGLLGRTPLFGAAWNNHKEIVELLITNGANINAKDENGETPLDGSDTIEITNLLRKHGGKTEKELKAEGK